MQCSMPLLPSPGGQKPAVRRIFQSSVTGRQKKKKGIAVSQLFVACKHISFCCVQIPFSSGLPLISLYQQMCNGFISVFKREILTTASE